MANVMFYVTWFLLIVNIIAVSILALGALSEVRTVTAQLFVRQLLSSMLIGSVCLYALGYIG